MSRSFQLIGVDINIRITTDEMRKLNQTSLVLADGSGQLGTLGVYHELHCLVSIEIS